jgi:hypothetical protein
MLPQITPEAKARSSAHRDLKNHSEAFWWAGFSSCCCERSLRVLLFGGVPACFVVSISFLEFSLNTHADLCQHRPT